MTRLCANLANCIHDFSVLKAYFHSIMYCDCFSYEWYLDLNFQTDSADIFSFYNDRVDLNCFSL